MAFELKDRDLAGRIGRLRTKGGEVETPVFMPVINPVIQTISPKRMKNEFQCKIIITNSYLIKKHFGDVHELDVHRLLEYPGVVMTDSGAYQILVYGGVEVTQSEIIEYQKKIGSDIAVILDIPTGWDVPREQVEYTVEETLRRAEAALPLIETSPTLWVGPIQGGKHLDLVASSAKKIGAMPFKIHALGSPTEVMERYNFPVLIDMIATAKRHIPLDRPLHLFGAGHPMMFSLAVALGCDLFDSASYALYAKDDRYMTTAGTLHIKQLTYLPCSCPICNKYTADELRELPKGERERLIAEHNLHICMSEITTVKHAIVEGSLWDLVERRSRGHPSMASALKHLSSYREDLERGHPGFKGHGAFYYGAESLTRPEITKHQRLLKENYKKPENADTLLLLTPPPRKPFNSSTEYHLLQAETKIIENPAIHVCFYAAPYGVIPERLAETYPLSQYEIAVPLDLETIRFTAKQVVEYIKSSGHNRVILYRTRGDLEEAIESAVMDACEATPRTLVSIWNSNPWSVDAFKILKEALKTVGSSQTN
jgi:7-cyano-7-deazaguanine tRNA-ribosyltransferase